MGRRLAGCVNQPQMQGLRYESVLVGSPRSAQDKHMPRSYPPLDPPAFKNVRIVARLAAEDPNYFSDPACPYPIDVVEFFRGIPGARKANGTVPVELQSLDLEVEELLKQLKSLQQSFDSQTSQKEQLDYIKAATSLLGKLMELKEKAAHVSDVEEFKRTVLALLADVFTPEQRTTFMDRLGEHGNI